MRGERENGKRRGSKQKETVQRGIGGDYKELFCFLGRGLMDALRLACRAMPIARSRDG